MFLFRIQHSTSASFPAAAATVAATQVVVFLLFVLQRPTGADGWCVLSTTLVALPPHGCTPSGSSRSTTSQLFAVATTEATSLAQLRTLEVCLSPGCVADGAEGVLLKLQALAPSCAAATTIEENSNIVVARGVCCKLCAYGPAARDRLTGRKHRKLADSNQKIVALLSLDAGTTMDPNQEAVLEGIDMCLKGDADLQRKNYKGAIQHYAKGIQRGMNAAIALNSIITNDSNDDTNTNTNNDTSALQWVVRALCNEATAKLHTKDTDGTIISAQTAYMLSQKRSSESLEALQEAYQTRGDDTNERMVLEALFALYEQQEQDEAASNVPRARRKRPDPMEANKRRNLGFRLTKLQPA